MYRNPIPYATGIASGDLNNDGIPDLMVVSPDDGLIEVRLGEGDGTFGHLRYSLAGNSPSVVTVGKFAGKNLDAVVNDGDTGGGLVLLGDGQGGFSSSSYLDTGGNYVFGFAVADFNGDGKQDIAALVDIPSQNSDSSAVYLYLGNGDGTFQSPRQLPVSPLGPAAILAGDFNGDGKADLVIVSAFLHDQSGRLSVLLGNGRGDFGRVIVFPLHGLSNLPSIASADFNGDGRPDLVLAYLDNYLGKSSHLRVLLGKGDGTFREGSQKPPVRYPLSVASADFNGDAITDLVVVNPCSAKATDFDCISVLAGNGDGTFQLPAQFRVHGKGIFQLTVADFNGDGKPDVATVNVNSQNVSVLLNTTQFPAPKTKPVHSRRH